MRPNHAKISGGSLLKKKSNDISGSIRTIGISLVVAERGLPQGQSRLRAKTQDDAQNAADGISQHPERHRRRLCPRRRVEVTCRPTSTPIQE